MKNIIYLLISFTLLSCSTSDDSNSIVGKWKLLRITSDGTYTPALMDYSDKNIIYNFTSHYRSNMASGYELIIDGEENSGYQNGSYGYQFREDYLNPGPWGEDDQKILLVSINGSKYSYSYSPKDRIMILGQSHIEGGNDFVFKKVK